MNIAIGIVLTLVFLAAVSLEKIFAGLPLKELRRRARNKNDKKAHAFYKLAAFGRVAELFLWLVAALSLAGLALITFQYSWWAGFLAIMTATWLTWRPLKRRDSRLVSLVVLITPLFSYLISLLQPILTRVPYRSKPHPPSGLYEKDDLLDFLKSQARQADNRISVQDLKTAHGALSYADKTVGQVMTPRRKVKWIAANDPVGPMVMDELHKTGQSRFPVVKEVSKSGNPEVVGTLYLKDLLEHLEDKGRLRDIMHPGASFINESNNLRTALDGFLKSGQYLLVVVNNFEETVGILTFEAVLEQVLGEKIVEDFENYGDSRFVAQQTDGQETQD